MSTRALFGFCLLALLGSAQVASAQCSIDETFDGGFTNPWVVIDPTWTAVADDALEVWFSSSNPSEYHGAVLDPCVYYDLRAGVRMRDLDDTKGKAIAFRNNGIYIGYNVNVRSSPWNDVVLGKGSFAPAAILTSAYLPNLTGEWVDVEIEAVGARIKVWVNGELMIDYVDPQPILRGWMFLGINAGGTGSGHAQFDDFWVEDLGAAVSSKTVTWSALKNRF
jgi:hypothetical protein